MTVMTAPTATIGSVTIGSSTTDSSTIDCTRPILVKRLRLSTRSKAEWNWFAEKCEATYFCSYVNVICEKLRRRVLLFEISCDDIKIAQCAVAVDWFGSRRQFLDSLQILPCHAPLWGAAMQELLSILGPGTYHYGSKWNIEPPRHAALTAIPGVKLQSVSAYHVHVVDFSRWDDWESYEKAISTNIRRNAAKAVKTDPATAIVLNRGVSAIKDVFSLIGMRFVTRRRKGLEDFNRVVATIRYAARTFLVNGYTAKVIHANRVVAYFSGIDFGSITFYLDGASLQDNGGASWYLMLHMLKRAWKPNGKVLMGMHQPGTDWAGRENILLSRRHCRVSEFPSSVVTFSYGSSDYGA